MTEGYYDDGTASTSGDAVTGLGTAWLLADVREGDKFGDPAQGLWVPIAAVISNTALILAADWPGTPLLGAAYAVERLPDLTRSLEASTQLRLLLDGHAFFQYDALGSLSDRAGYDTRQKGFSFLDITTDPMSVWVKASNASGDWAGPTAFIAGPEGRQGGTGGFGTNPRGPWNSATSYSYRDLVTDPDADGNDAAWVALTTNLNSRPRDNPTDWFLFPVSFYAAPEEDYGLFAEPTSNTDDYGTFA